VSEVLLLLALQSLAVKYQRFGEKYCLHLQGKTMVTTYRITRNKHRQKKNNTHSHKRQLLAVEDMAGHFVNIRAYRSVNSSTTKKLPILSQYHD
jgi:hypothetical protein